MKILKQLGTISFVLLSTTNPLSAQVIPDATLTNNSVVIPQNNNFRIEGGTQSGSNLFHSFQEFSVPTGGEAFFNNAQNIQNIFSRVTGGNISNIDGLIRANGTANLFVINPNGIIFGSSAQLNIGGSFIGSTANSIRFMDGSEFSATNPNPPPLLTINLPVGLQFGTNPQNIINRSQANSLLPIPPLLSLIPIPANVGLQVFPGQTLALIGGNIILNGGNLTANSGEIHLGSVASPGLVSFTPTSTGLSFNYDNIQNFGNIEISDGSIINTSGLGSGKIQIRGGFIALDNSRIYALTLGNIDGRGIEIDAQNLRVEGGAQIFSGTLGDGEGSDTNIRVTDSVEIIGLGIESYQQFYSKYLASGTLSPFEPQLVLNAGTVGRGAAGDINIDTGRLVLRDGVVGGTVTFGAGNGGNMNIRANTIEIASSSLNNGTTKESTGQGGSITVEAQQLIMRDGASLVSVSRSDGTSGNIAIKTNESVELSGSLPGGTAQTVISTNSFSGNGKAGDISIDTKRLIISDGGAISSSTGVIVGEVVLSTSGGAGGNLTVRSSESIELSGDSTRILGNAGYATTALATVTTSPGRGGDIYLSTPKLSVWNGGVITAASLGVADAGNIIIDAYSIEVQGIGSNNQFRSRIEASAGNAYVLGNPSTLGNAGLVNLNARELTIKDGATVTVQSLGTGRAGNVNVFADALVLDNQSSIDGRTVSGEGANINLQVPNIQLRRGSRIGTDAGNATGGNITINTSTLVALQNSDITANAAQGSGGEVSITAQGIFGTEFRNQLTPQSDITATSDLGPQFNGIVEINTPEVNPAVGIVELSTNFTDIRNQIVVSCRTYRDNNFVITGRGGLPEDPNQTLIGNTVWRDLRAFDELSASSHPSVPASSSSQSPVPNPQSPIVEATGWVKNADGKVELITQSTMQNYLYKLPQCKGFSSNG